MDATWMGLPVLSWCGKTAVSRAGLSQSSNLGMPELTAMSQADYIRLAVELANDPPRLAELRRIMRPRMQASPLMDAPRFARGIEAAFRTMWRHWCEKQKY
jgi:predicted O-linked N-acetylglucosamine transferase (SPINDLY family)